MERTTSDALANRTPTIESLLAIEACREAARRYSYGVDRLDVEVMRSAYWPDATDDHGVFVGNAWEFCERVVGSHDRWSWTMHGTENHRVEIDDDGVRARGEMHAIARLFVADERRLDTFYGRYLDTYECRDGEWRISHRVCVHHGDTSEHVPDSMGLDASRFRPGSFDRPANQRRIGP
ncbi:nuclear transport factor 2 family protein [Ilumatobacter sp.]|uniref:nuclear transport factor 2 family protein n=1 Tax=Ilumatobacter sp. TaxID=1967498 RepID=UPI003B52C7C9